ncbi:MAG: NAD-dependent epimerase/dehydratase family protein [Myxococcota bacterium]
MRRVLVTGAAGFLGFALARRLSDDAATEVIVVDNFVRGERDAAYEALCRRPNVVERALDLADAGAVADLPSEVEVIFHMAALNGTQNFYERPLEVMRCSTLPTMALLARYASSASLKRFVYAGTSEAYAGTVRRFGWPVPTAEDVPLCIEDVTNPRWSYAVSKLHGEVAVCNACRVAEKEFVIIRFHNAYGPRMGDKHVVPDFIARMLEGRYVLYGYEDTRAFIYVDDAVQATIALGSAAAAAGEVVNLGGTTETRIEDLGRLLMKLHGVDGELELAPSPPGSVSRRVPDVTKLERLIDFRPTVTLEEGLRRTLDDYVSMANNETAPTTSE